MDFPRTEFSYFDEAKVNISMTGGTSIHGGDEAIGVEGLEQNATDEVTEEGNTKQDAPREGEVEEDTTGSGNDEQSAPEEVSHDENAEQDSTDEETAIDESLINEETMGDETASEDEVEEEEEEEEEVEVEVESTNHSDEGDVAENESLDEEEIMLEIEMGDLSAAMEVGDFSELKRALESGVSEVQLISGNTYEATSDIKLSTGMIIYGNHSTLNMGVYRFLLTGTKRSLEVSELTVNSTTGSGNHRYGVFCLADSNGTSGSPYYWDAKFTNVTFNGAALIGIGDSDSTTVKNYIREVEFSGTNTLTLTNYSANNAVVFARNITINDAFTMKDKIISSGVTGASSAAYGYYFRSPGTGGAGTQNNATTAFGTFEIAAGANVDINRNPGPSGLVGGVTSEYNRSLIYGYQQFTFGENAIFNATAGTNRATEVNSRSAVIRSDAATSFTVADHAQVTLATNLVNNVTDYYGFTALYLKKSADLNISIGSGATLNTTANGNGAIGRAHAPVMLMGAGSSTTTVNGDVNVYSENGNGWYYEYRTSSTPVQKFYVESAGKVEIKANNEGEKGAVEYAAFEAYGNYDMDIIVRGGGQMTVFSNGYRGMSLAGAGSYAKKSITVDGAESSLSIKGTEWAIAAETQPTLSISATNGGRISLESSVVNNASGGAASTVYSVGPTTYTVNGEGSEINIAHKAGTYSAIFHDGYGPLTINISNGGAMDVYNVNSGTDTSARRAAITAQSTALGDYGSYENSINITGEKSILRVENKNSLTHGNGLDTGLYPTGAISFNSSARGSIDVSEGGSLIAISSSLAPTIHLYQGKITFDNPGEFDIRNNSTSASTGSNSRYATTGQAIFNNRRLDETVFYPAIKFINSDVKVWTAFEDEYSYDDAHMDNAWEKVSFTGDNKGIADTGKEGSGGDGTVVSGKLLPQNDFYLSAYGRITNASGSNTEDDVATGDFIVTKVDANHEEKGLSGAEFLLCYKDGEVSYYYDGIDEDGDITWDEGMEGAEVLTTDSSGQLMVSNLNPGTYYLIEIKAPEGYVTPVEDEAVMEIIVVKDQVTEEVIKNTAAIAMIDFTFTKVDAAEYEVPLVGAEFTLTNTAADEFVGSQESGSDGRVTFVNLESGTYLLEETKAPNGYELPLGQWEVEVNAENGVIAITTVVGEAVPPAFRTNEETGEYLVGNVKKYTLPAAGSGGSQWFMRIGGTLLASGVVMVMLKRRLLRRW